MFNIVGNAIKFTSQGNVGVLVHIDRDEGKQLNLDVSDTGPGISLESQSRLFEPFTQADASTTRKFGGTGLGLALSRRLARALGGDVTLLSSDLGVGSKFRVTIDPGATSQIEFIAQPTEWRSSEVGDDHRVSPSTEPSFAGKLNGIKVLVVDDSADNRVLLERILTKSGAQVNVASTSIEGMSLALKNNFDVVLMDIQMPELDGYEATSILRRRGYRAPILALTAHAMKSARALCLAHGFDGYLTKPVHRQELESQVKEAAFRWRERAQTHGPETTDIGDWQQSIES